MDIKKKAFFSRLEKEYNKLLVEKWINLTW